MNREQLKQAIAEAKTIKETAIANAKLALEEAFTPQLTAMFAEKLNELEEEEEKVEEAYSMEEEGLEETFNIDEILAELEMTDEAKEIEEAEDMKEETLDEELMLEEMSDEEIEELVTQVIDDMIASGKLMAGEESEKEEESEEEMDMNDMEMDAEEESEEEEVDLDELLAEMESMDEEKEEVAEVSGESMDLVLKAAEVLGTSTDVIKGVLASLPPAVAAASFLRGIIKAKKEETNKEMSDVSEMESTINELRNELNEVNLLNAKLLYTNKIFRAKNLTESEKVKVLNTFDKATNVKEVKLVFETLTESLKTKTTKPSPIKESLGGASKVITPATPKQPIVEVNEAFARMQRLAGIKK
jgi:hypothetical protein